MKKIITFALSLILCSAIFSGCSSSNKFNTLKSNKTINIAILGSEKEDIAERQDFFAGVNIAIEELAKVGVNVKYKVFNDDGSFDAGVSNARAVIADKDYMLAFTSQAYETVDTVAKLFEDAQKPLIVIDGSFDETMEKNYNYILNLTLSAQDQGRALGSYAVNCGYKWIAVAHSNTKYNLDFVEGFDDSVDQSTSSKIIDSVGKLEKASDFPEVLTRWQTLGVDAVVLSYENTDWAMELVKLIRENAPNIAILSDSYFNNLSYMDRYADYLQGVVMPSSYPVDSNERLEKFYNDYEERSNVPLTSISAQGFDTVKMIVEKLSNANTAAEFMSAMKAPEGYEGITGLKFTQSGQLNKEAKYWVIKDKTVYRMETLA